MGLIEELAAEAGREDLPPTLHKLVVHGLAAMEDLLEAVRAENFQLAHEIMEGTTRPDGRRRPDGIAQILPRWARGTEVLDALQGVVMVDEDVTPVSVTVHWELVPRKLRAQAASLASELVDAYNGRPKGGRPPRSGKNAAPKPGDPIT